MSNSHSEPHAADAADQEARGLGFIDGARTALSLSGMKPYVAASALMTLIEDVMAVTTCPGCRAGTVKLLRELADTVEAHDAVKH